MYIKRFISIITLVAVLFGDSTLATEVLFENSASGGINLAPPLLSGSLGDNIYHHKYMALGEIALQADLQNFARRLDLNRNAITAQTLQEEFLRQERFHEERTVFNPANITLYFKDLTEITPKIFYIPASVSKYGERKDFFLIFSIATGKDGIFPITSCLKEELEDIKAGIMLQSKLPGQRRSDRDAIDRYIRHEEIIDLFIEERIAAGDFAEISGRAEFLKLDSADPAEEENAPRLPHAAFWKRVKATKLWPDSFWKRVKGETDNLVGALGTDCEAALQDKNVVFIRVPEGVKYPLMREQGADIIVRSHTSKNAIYLFLDEEDFDALDLMYSGRLKGPMSLELRNRIEKIYPYLTKILTHEIGVSYGLPYAVEEGKIKNDLSRAMDGRQKDLSVNTLLAKYPALKKLLDPPADLDNNLPTRDYASGDSIYDDADKTDLTREEVEEKVGEIWASVDNLGRYPLSEEANRALVSICKVIHVCESKEYGLTCETFYKMLFASLYAEYEYRQVAYGIEQTLIREDSFKKYALKTNYEVLYLYFMAIIMDPERIKDVRAQDLFSYYTNMFPRRDIGNSFVMENSKVKLEFKRDVYKRLMDFIEYLRSKGNYKLAIQITDNLIIHLGNEQALAGKKIYADYIKNLYDSKSEIAREAIFVEISRELSGKVLTAQERFEAVLKMLTERDRLLADHLNNLKGFSSEEAVEAISRASFSEFGTKILRLAFVPLNGSKGPGDPQKDFEAQAIDVESSTVLRGTPFSGSAEELGADKFITVNAYSQIAGDYIDKELEDFESSREMAHIILKAYLLSQCRLLCGSSLTIDEIAGSQKELIAKIKEGDRHDYGDVTKVLRDMGLLSEEYPDPKAFKDTDPIIIFLCNTMHYERFKNDDYKMAPKDVDIKAASEASLRATYKDLARIVMYERLKGNEAARELAWEVVDAFLLRRKLISSGQSMDDKTVIKIKNSMIKILSGMHNKEDLRKVLKFLPYIGLVGKKDAMIGWLYAMIDAKSRGVDPGSANIPMALIREAPAVHDEPGHQPADTPLRADEPLNTDKKTAVKSSSTLINSYVQAAYHTLGQSIPAGSRPYLIASIVLQAYLASQRKCLERSRLTVADIAYYRQAIIGEINEAAPEDVERTLKALKDIFILDKKYPDVSVSEMDPMVAFLCRMIMVKSARSGSIAGKPEDVRIERTSTNSLMSAYQLLVESLLEARLKDDAKAKELALDVFYNFSVAQDMYLAGDILDNDSLAEIRKDMIRILEGSNKDSIELAIRALDEIGLIGKNDAMVDWLHVMMRAKIEGRKPEDVEIPAALARKAPANYDRPVHPPADAPAQEEATDEIDRIWDDAKDVISSQPFSDKAQEAFKRINSISYTYHLNRKMDSDKWRKILTALLYGKQASRLVIAYIDDMLSKRDADAKKPAEDLLKNEDLIKLYFVARMMDAESINKAAEERKEFFSYYIEKLFGPNSRHSPMFADDMARAKFQQYVRDIIISFARHLGSIGKNDHKLELINSLMAYFIAYKQIIVNVKIAKLCDNQIDSLLDLRKVTMGQANASLGESAVYPRMLTEWDKLDVMMLYVETLKKYKDTTEKQALEVLRHVDEYKVSQESDTRYAISDNTGISGRLERGDKGKWSWALRGGGLPFNDNRVKPLRVNSRFVGTSPFTMLDSYALMARNYLSRQEKEYRHGAKIAGMVLDAYILSHERHLDNRSLTIDEISALHKMIIKELARAKNEECMAAAEYLRRIFILDKKSEELSLTGTNTLVSVLCCPIIYRKHRNGISFNDISIRNASTVSLISAYRSLGHKLLAQAIDKTRINAANLAAFIFSNFIRNQERVLDGHEIKTKDIKDTITYMSEILEGAKAVDVFRARKALNDIGLIGKKDAMVDWLCNMMDAKIRDEDPLSVRPPAALFQPSYGRLLSGEEKMAALEYYAAATGISADKMKSEADKYRVLELIEGRSYHVVQMDMNIGTYVLKDEYGWRAIVDGGGILRPQDTIKEIDRIWSDAGDDIYRNFTKEAQDAYGKIVALTKQWNMREFPYETFYKIIVSKLYGARAYREVMEDIERVIANRNDSDSFADTMLKDKSLVDLYFIAAIMNSGDTSNTYSRGSFRYYTTKLFGRNRGAELGFREYISDVVKRFIEYNKLVDNGRSDCEDEAISGTKLEDKAKLKAILLLRKVITPHSGWSEKAGEETEYDITEAKKVYPASLKGNYTAIKESDFSYLILGRDFRGRLIKGDDRQMHWHSFKATIAPDIAPAQSVANDVKGGLLQDDITSSADVMLANVDPVPLQEIINGLPQSYKENSTNHKFLAVELEKALLADGWDSSRLIMTSKTVQGYMAILLHKIVERGGGYCKTMDEICTKHPLLKEKERLLLRRYGRDAKAISFVNIYRYLDDKNDLRNKDKRVLNVRIVTKSDDVERSPFEPAENPGPFKLIVDVASNGKLIKRYEVQLNPSTNGKVICDKVEEMLRQVTIGLRSDQNILEWTQDMIAKGTKDLSDLDEKSALIFSDTVTFKHGLGVLLPKLANSGIKVAVVASSEEKKKVIKDLIRKFPGSRENIVCGDNIMDIKTRMARKGIARYKYFKVEGDPVAGEDKSIDTFDITNMIKNIIEALGKSCSVPIESLPDLHKAAKEFSLYA